MDHAEFDALVRRQVGELYEAVALRFGTTNGPHWASTHTVSDLMQNLAASSRQLQPAPLAPQLTTKP